MSGSLRWKPALFYAIPISLLIAGLFYYWFAVANRYVIFLYGHLGATPFDQRTNSRYWMSGLVAAGIVMVLYAGVNWFGARVAGIRYQVYVPPLWWQVWLLCLAPVTIGILAITMTCNQPTLPFTSAAACVVATLTALAFALAPGAFAALCPAKLGWLVVIGAGLVPSLLLLRAIELPGKGFANPSSALPLALGGTLAGALWSTILASLQAWWQKSHLGINELFVAAMCLSYLLLPLAHHLLLTPTQYRYISSSTNFFAFERTTQLICFFVAAVLSIGIAQLQKGIRKLMEEAT